MKQWKKIAALLGLVAVLVAVNLRQNSAPASTPLAGRRPNPDRAAGKPQREILDDVLRVERLETVTRVDVVDIRRNIFEYGSRPAATPEVEPVVETPPPPPPPPKPPVRFYGFADRQRGGPRRVFLTDGEEIYVAAQGDVILRRYRLVRVGNDSVEIEEVTGKNRWVVPLEQP